jgi:hypothetical protein
MRLKWLAERPHDLKLTVPTAPVSNLIRQPAEQEGKHVPTAAWINQPTPKHSSNPLKKLSHPP